MTTEQPTGRAPWWERRTLRFRALASVVAVMLLAFAIIGTVTVLALNRFLLGRLDQQLDDACARYVAAVTDFADDESRGVSGRDEGGFGDARDQAIGTLGARISGRQVSQLGILGRPKLPTPTRGVVAKLVALPAGHDQSVDLEPLGDYRMRAVRLPDGSRVVVGLPLRPIHETLAELLTVELGVFGGVLALTVVCGGWLIGLSLRPLHRITTTARRVSESSLDADDPNLPHRVEAIATDTEVGQLGNAFNHMLDHIESGLQARHETEQRLRHFIADASHELRTPVAAVRGHAESVRLLREPVPDAVRESMERIEAEAKRMGILVDDLLSLARLDSGRAGEVTTVDLSLLVVESLSDAQVASRGHHWTLSIPDQPILVIGNELRLRELVTNLLTNARVHTPIGTTVGAALSVDEAASRAVLVICDDGPGIPLELQSRVFERFFRSSGERAPMTGSSGLGLAIVDAIAQTHGGEVTVESRPGRTCFTVRLPLAEPVSEETHSEP